MRKVHETILHWRHVGFDQRSAHLRAVAQALRSQAETCAHLMACEMGKPVRDGVAEIKKCAACCDFFAEQAAVMLAREDVKTEARTSFVMFQPLGVILAVMPWNLDSSISPLSSTPSAARWSVGR